MTNNLNKVVVDSSMEIDDEEVFIEGMITYSIDSSYSSDADGNRGVRAMIVEDCEITYSNTFNENRNENVYELKTQDIERAQEILTNKFLQEGV
jgi:pimeloyl-CoA synthetase